jgi:hypothetical protein
MSTAKHADLEALSAFVDGEAPEWADHVAGCPVCRATAAELRALSARVAAPADPPPAAQREAAIAAALGAGDELLATGDGQRRLATPSVTSSRDQAVRVARRREPGRLRRPQAQARPWAMPAVAAVVVALLGLSGVILSANRSTDEATTFAGPALDSKAESSVAGALNAPVGDLGEVPDAATLRARAALLPAASSAGAGVSTGRSASSSAATGDAAVPPSATNSGSTGAAISPLPATAAGGAGGSSAAISPNAVGTRPCEERARSREPGLGPVSYFATARRGNVSAYVLGFATGPNVTLLMLAQDGCSELLRSVGP